MKKLLDEVTKEEKKEGVGVFPTENVNHPEHYSTGNIDWIDAMYFAKLLQQVVLENEEWC